MSPIPPPAPAAGLPLRITTAEDGRPSVVLDGMELRNVLSNVAIEYVSYGNKMLPQIFLTFGPGLLDLDFDVDLLETMLASARERTRG